MSIDERVNLAKASRLTPGLCAMITMRAKFEVKEVISYPGSGEQLRFGAVSGDAVKTGYPPGGEDEDSTFSRYTPSAELTMYVSNPALFGRFKEGDTFYVDFTPAVQPDLSAE